MLSILTVRSQWHYNYWIIVKTKNYWKKNNFGDITCYYNSPVTSLKPLLLTILFTRPPGLSLWLSRCPCGGAGFAIRLPGITPHCCQARRMVPPFFPHQPACSHHRLFPAEVFVCLWASWNMDLVQMKANPTKTMSNAQRQHTKGTGILNRERQSPLSAAAPTYAKQKWWQL